VLHYWIKTFDGVGIAFFDSFAEMLGVVSRLSLMLLLILIAQGWGTLELSIMYKQGILGLMGGIAFCYCMMLLWDIKFRDPASTLYLYESIPGMLILLLDCVATGWFVYSTYQTHLRPKIPKEKADFLKRMGYAYVSYLIALPILVTVACFLSPWVREKTVFTLNALVACVAHMGLLYLFWPSRVHSYFEIKGPDPFEGNEKDEQEALL